MKLNRLFVGLSGVAMLGLHVGAEPQVHPSAQSSPSASQPVASTPSSPAVQQFIQRLVGEWDGSIELRRDGGVSSSVVNISSQLQKDGKAVFSCFDGFAFGQAFEGGSMVGFNPKTGQFESAWFDHTSGSTMRCTASEPTTDSTLVFTGRLTAKSGQSVSVEQVITMTDFTRYTNEWFTVSDSGEKTRMMYLEMTRLPQGQLSAAAEKLKNVAEQARNRGMANVPSSSRGQD